jgi:toxin ParE1/3/4
MAKARTISLAQSAVEDLEGIRSWYIEQQAPEAGTRLIKEIISEIKSLSRFPERGRVVPEFNVQQLREIIYPPFRIVYRLDSIRIRIVRVWRSERLLKID